MMKTANGMMMSKQNNLFSKLLMALLISTLTVSVAVASPLTKPKANGWIGEQANGYIGLVTNDVPADVIELVNEVNAKRRAGYIRIAKEQGASLMDVEKVGGNTAIEKTLPGNYIRDPGGAWHKK